MSVQVILGDCLEILPTLPAASFDAVITDPPYGIDLRPQRGRTKPIVGDKREDAQKLWAAFVPEVYRLLKPNTASLFFSRWSEVWVKNILDRYFAVKACIVWKKNVWGIGYYTRPQHEFIWYCHKGKPARPERPESDVWEASRVQTPVHACEKPVSLLCRAVRFVCPPGGTVLDPFGGSGTTAIAAMREGRNAVLIERVPEYVDIAKRRIAEEQAKMAAKHGGLFDTQIAEVAA